VWRIAGLTDGCAGTTVRRVFGGPRTPHAVGYTGECAACGLSVEIGWCEAPAGSAAAHAFRQYALRAIQRTALSRGCAGASIAELQAAG
jgi:hypothetical protein